MDTPAKGEKSFIGVREVDLRKGTFKELYGS
jgi:hypothetical protein